MLETADFVDTQNKSLEQDSIFKTMGQIMSNEGRDREDSSKPEVGILFGTY